jgi:hypothetical protein
MGLRLPPVPWPCLHLAGTRALPHTACSRPRPGHSISANALVRCADQARWMARRANPRTPDGVSA